MHHSFYQWIICCFTVVSLQAAAFGKCFLTDYNPEAYVNMCQMLRVLNQVRNHVIGIPLTYSQYPSKRLIITELNVVYWKLYRKCNTPVELLIEGHEAAFEKLFVFLLFELSCF